MKKHPHYPSISTRRRSLSLLVLVFLLSLGTVAIGHAAKLYKYRNAAGALVFSDRPMENLQPLDVRQVAVNQRQERVALRPTGPRERPVLLAVNELWGPVQLEVDLVERENLQTSVSLPARWVLPAGGQVETVGLAPEDGQRSWSYRYSYRFVPGRPDARHAPPGPYLVPFAAGLSFPVSQGFKGTKSHNGPANAYAVDIAMPEGTPIRAARAGTIMDVAFDFYDGGMDRNRFGDKANLIRILHDDGSMAIYAHLRLESARFPIGSRVAAGDIIAESGNTGYSSGPHLHFAVQRNTGMSLRAEPFVFAGANGQPLTPERGMQLTAY